MAGIMNHSARQYNLKSQGKTGRTVVRIAPGFNVVDDEHWGTFVPKSGKMDAYVAKLKKSGALEFGAAMDDMELEMAPDTVAKSKFEPIEKLKEAIKEAEGAKEASEAETVKANAEAETAKAEAETAKAETVKA